MRILGRFAWPPWRRQISGSVFQAPSGAAVERGKWGRAHPSACRFLLDAVRSWVQFGLEPSCQGPWIVAVEHVTQTLLSILDGSLPGGPFCPYLRGKGAGRGSST